MFRPVTRRLLQTRPLLSVSSGMMVAKRPVGFVKRGYSTGDHHHQKTSDLPWLISALLVTIPGSYFLIQQGPSPSDHHSEHHDDKKTGHAVESNKKSAEGTQDDREEGKEEKDGEESKDEGGDGKTEGEKSSEGEGEKKKE